MHNCISEGGGCHIPEGGFDFGPHLVDGWWGWHSWGGGHLNQRSRCSWNWSSNNTNQEITNIHCHKNTKRRSTRHSICIFSVCKGHFDAGKCVTHDFASKKRTHYKLINPGKACLLISQRPGYQTRTRLFRARKKDAGRKWSISSGPSKNISCPFLQRLSWCRKWHGKLRQNISRTSGASFLNTCQWNYEHSQVSASF